MCDDIGLIARKIISQGGQLTSVYVPHDLNGEHEVRFSRDRLYDLIVEALENNDRD